MVFHAADSIQPTFRRKLTRFSSTLRYLIPLWCIVLAAASSLAQTPATGTKAPNFTLFTSTGNP